MKKRITSILSFTAVVVLMMIMMITPVFADEPGDDEVHWVPLTDTISYYLDDEGNLTIDGSGEIPDFTQFAPNPSPFKENNDIKKVEIKGEITAIGAYLFYNCDSLETVVLPSDIKKIGTYAFSQCNKLGTLDFPEGLEEIGKYAFDNCTSITKIILPDSLTILGEGSFGNCIKVKTLVLSNNLTDISYAFEWCTQLRNITIPEGVVKMESAFPGCTDLKKITIPATVKNLIYCFDECYGLDEVTFEGDCPALDLAFFACDITVRYPFGNDTWTKEVMDSGYGGKVKWEGYCIEHDKASAVKENLKAATALKSGSYDKVVYCKVCGGELSRQKVTIAKLKPTVKLSAKKKSLKAGKSYTLKITGLAKGDAVKSFKSSKKAIATVSPKGKIKAKKKGKTVITVTLKSGKKASCKITVK